MILTFLIMLLFSNGLGDLAAEVNGAAKTYASTTNSCEHCCNQQSY